MLGYVPESLLKAEIEQRARAQTVADERMVTIARLQLEIDRLERMLTAERESHERQMTTLLEHVVPLEKDAPPAPPGAALKEMTPEDILAMPAHGKREMFLREKAYRAAKRRQDTQKDEHEQQQREASLTDDERKELHGTLNDMLGTIEMPAARTEEAAT